MTTRPGRRQAAVACGLLWPFLASSAAGAADPSWSAASGFEFQPELLLRQSRWRETRSDGRTLLEERGLLPGLGLRGRWAAAPWAVEVSTHALRGRRDYVGQTNDGAAATTRVDVEQQGAALVVSQHVGSQWRLRSAWEPGLLHRTLRDTPQAQGYRERWTWTTWTLGVEHVAGTTATAATAATAATMGTAGSGWRIGAAAGPVLNPRLRVTLPGMDAATARPERGVSWRGWAEYRLALAPSSGLGWEFGAGLHAARTTFDASDTVPLYANGVLRGGMTQPATVWRDAQLALTATARWR